MKTIITLDRANQPYGYPQLNASGNFDNIIVSGLTATTLSATTYLNLPVTTDTFVTGFTLSSNTITLRQNRTGQYSAFTISLSAYTGSSSASGAYLPLSGGTVSGRTIFTSGITANTISATTYLNLPTDIRTTGATYSDNTFTFNSNSGGTATTFSVLFNTVTGLTANTLNVTGNALLSGLTAATISATTYQNVNAVTGGTYSNGTITLSGTGNVNGTQITGFGTGGGGGGQIFYLNLSQSQNGNRFLSTTASTATEQTSGVTISNGVTSTIASFQTTPLNISLIPGGIWSFYLHSYKQDNNSSFNIFVEVYKITSGGSPTLLFATDPAPVTTNSPNPSMQLTDGYFSGTSLNVSDGVVAVVKATNTDNQPHIITLVTEGSQHYSYVVSTIPTQQGLTCETLSGCSIIQTINTDISNKFDKSGGTVSGATNFISGLTANTISATTWYGLPSSSFSGGTVTGPTDFTNGLTANTITVISGLTATTVSATTYQNVNAVTGGTYDSGTGTITLSGTGNVNGNTITGLSSGGSFTGGTVSGATNFTGGVTANTLTVSAATNPVKFVGLQSASDTSVLTIDGTGVVHTIPTSSLGGGGITWQYATSPITASTGNGYITTGTTSIALPTLAALGSAIDVISASDNLFTITQGASQLIRFGIITTTQGAGGTLVSQNNGDSIRLVCTSANTIFTVVSSVGTLTLN